MAATADKPLVWLKGEIKTPPFSKDARIEAGVLLRRLQRGVKLGMPESRAMPTIGRRCHELRVEDENRTWRIVYRIDDDAVKTQQRDRSSTSAGGGCVSTTPFRREVRDR